LTAFAPQWNRKQLAALLNLGIKSKISILGDTTAGTSDLGFYHDKITDIAIPKTETDKENSVLWIRNLERAG
jgi:hypothetical protein